MSVKLSASFGALLVSLSLALAACSGASQLFGARLNGDHIELGHQIQFESNSDRINEGASTTTLRDLIDVIRANPNIRRMRVEGYTDTVGDAGRNQELSRQRAQAVVAYLQAHGIHGVQFEVIGRGESSPLCGDETPECHARNRRVEFTITQREVSPITGM